MTGMAQLRQRLSAGKPVKEAWGPPALSDFCQGLTVLSFDQSLSSTGWVCFRIPPGSPGCEVTGRGTLRPETREKGFLETWDKARQLSILLNEIFVYSPHDSRWLCSVFATYTVLESPPVGRGFRPESSLLAGYLIYERVPASRRVIVSAQHASSVLCGNPHHSKKEIKAAVCRYFPGAEGRDWNEHQRDAAALGLAFLYDRAKEQRDDQ